MKNTILGNPLNFVNSLVHFWRRIVNHAIFWTLLKYGLGIGLLVYVLWAGWSPASGRGGFGSLWQKHVVDKEPVNFQPLVFGCIICLVSTLLTFVRWYVLVRAQELPFTLPNAMRLGLIGFAMSTFLPGSIGGDIIKAAFIAREQSRRTVAVATVLIDRAIGLWALCWLVALLGVVFWIHGDLAVSSAEITLQWIVFFAVGLIAATMVLWGLLRVLPPWRADRFAGRLQRIPKVGHSAAEFWRAIWMYRCKGGSVLLSLVMSLAGHLGFVLTFYMAARTLYDPRDIPSLAEHYLIVPVGMAIQAGIPTPGGLGGGEFAFGKLYEAVNAPADSGTAACVVQRVITLALAFVGYLVYLRMRPALLAEQGAELQDPNSAALKESLECVSRGI